MLKLSKSAAFAALLLMFLSLSVFSSGGADDFLILVNAQNPLPAGYSPSALIPVRHTRGDGRPPQMMCPEAAEALDALLSELSMEFLTDDVRDAVNVTSGYRSFEYQKLLFERSVNDYVSRGMSETEARKKAGKFIAPPGTSEHETGLAADLHNLSSASQAFSETKEFLWLYENAHKYGFILRYPKNKESVTGIGFEPWHWRFVGQKAACEMRSLGLCLEEYLKYIKK